MGCRIICLPNARTSGPLCVSSRRDVVAGRLQDRTCRTCTRQTSREGRWRRLHKPQANAGPEFDGCLEVMDQASVFLLSRYLRRPRGQWCARLVIVLALSCAADLAGWSGPRLQLGGTHVFKYLCTYVPTSLDPLSSPSTKTFFSSMVHAHIYLSDLYTDVQNSPQAVNHRAGGSLPIRTLFKGKQV